MILSVEFTKKSLDILDRHACDIVGKELVTTLQLSFVHYNFISCDSVGRI